MEAMLFHQADRGMVVREEECTQLCLRPSRSLRSMVDLPVHLASLNPAELQGFLRLLSGPPGTTSMLLTLAAELWSTRTHRWFNIPQSKVRMACPSPQMFPSENRDP